MAASMVDHEISKQIVFRHISINLLVAVLISLIIYVPANSKGLFDIIANPILVTKVYCGLIAFIQIVLCFYLKQIQHIQISSVVRGAVIFAVSCAVFHIIAVLYGAPLTEATSETFHFSLLLSTTSVLPPCLFLGPRLDSWIRVFTQSRPELGPESVVHITSILAVVGAWLGAFPIPLDWDRPWQVWPISCVIGTMMGYCAGLVTSAVHLYYKYTVLNKVKLT